MRTVLVLMSLTLFLGLFGCASEEAQPLPDEALGEVNQEVGGPCRDHDWCPLGERCDFTQPHPGGDGVTMFSCTGYPVFGPSQNPCLSDLQCQRQWWFDSHCVFGSGASYGECIR